MGVNTQGCLKGYVKPEYLLNYINTYYISDTPDGFQSDLWDYYFESLEDLASQLYDEMRGNVTDIRIE